MSETLLEVRDLRVSYGHVEAVRGISLSVGAGEIVALIGPNGAGKSSALNAIAGLVRPAGGSVLLEGRELAGAPSHAAVAAGLVLVPEGRAILQRMSVLENLDIAAEGSIYASLTERPAELVRRSLGGDKSEPIGNFPGIYRRIITALPGGRTVFSGLASGRGRLMAAEKGKDPVPLVNTTEETSSPMTAVGLREIAFAIGPEPHQTIADFGDHQSRGGTTRRDRLSRSRQARCQRDRTPRFRTSLIRCPAAPTPSFRTDW